MTHSDDAIHCPCYPICSALGLEMGRWCRYHKSDLPPPGMHKFDPKATWCPTGVQANLLMLGHLLAAQAEDPERLAPALERVRRWARELRAQSVNTYSRSQPSPSSTGA